ncbi:MAG: hypothetical protein RLN76_07980 [Phycisphaeraceae bacterium]
MRGRSIGLTLGMLLAAVTTADAATLRWSGTITMSSGPIGGLVPVGSTWVLTAEYPDRPVDQDASDPEVGRYRATSAMLMAGTFNLTQFVSNTLDLTIRNDFDTSAGTIDRATFTSTFAAGSMLADIGTLASFFSNDAFPAQGLNIADFPDPIPGVVYDTRQFDIIIGVSRLIGMVEELTNTGPPVMTIPAPGTGLPLLMVLLSLRRRV